MFLFLKNIRICFFFCLFLCFLFSIYCCVFMFLFISFSSFLFRNSYFIVNCYFFFMNFLGSPVAFSMFTEFLPTKNRGLILVCFEAFWTAGVLLEAGLAW